MPSQIITFRDRIIEALKQGVPELRSVDWYDGLFDEQDVNDWIVEAPAAYVAAVSIPKNMPHTTGEMNACLRIIVTVVTEDKYNARDNDEQSWEIMEKIAILANMNRFGDPNAAPAETPMLKRLRDPGLRREGVALGVVEWDSGFTFGTNKSVEHEFIRNTETGEFITKVPDNLFLGHGTVYRNRIPYSEEVNLSPQDPASPYLDEDNL
jgi:hypothetical protein